MVIDSAQIDAAIRECQLPNHIKPADIFPLIDLTSLNATDDDQTIVSLCEAAKQHAVAAVCVYPQFVALAAQTLEIGEIALATVVNFPSGNHPLSQTLDEINEALEHGATEIDLVLPYQRYLQGDRVGAIDFVRTAKTVCANSLLKVILETGALQDRDVIADASRDLIDAGADFLKTSTGKIETGATLEAAAVILQTLGGQHPRVGFKASGGVRTFEQACHYLSLAKILRPNVAITAKNFRLGASGLLSELAKMSR